MANERQGDRVDARRSECVSLKAAGEGAKHQDATRVLRRVAVVAPTGFERTALRRVLRHQTTRWRHRRARRFDLIRET